MWSPGTALQVPGYSVPRDSQGTPIPYLSPGPMEPAGRNPSQNGLLPQLLSQEREEPRRPHSALETDPREPAHHAQDSRPGQRSLILKSDTSDLKSVKVEKVQTAQALTTGNCPFKESPFQGGLGPRSCRTPEEGAQGAVRGRRRLQGQLRGESLLGKNRWCTCVSRCQETRASDSLWGGGLGNRQWPVPFCCACQEHASVPQV